MGDTRRARRRQPPCCTSEETNWSQRIKVDGRPVFDAAIYLYLYLHRARYSDSDSDEAMAADLTDILQAQPLAIARVNSPTVTKAGL